MMPDGARYKFATPMFESEVFLKQMYCFEKSAHDIVGTFWPSAVILRPGISPLLTSLRLWCYAIKIGKFL